jgi:hypothetical protein
MHNAIHHQLRGRPQHPWQPASTATPNHPAAPTQSRTPTHFPDPPPRPPTATSQPHRFEAGNTEHAGAVFELLAQPLEWIGGPDLLPVAGRKLVNAKRSSAASRSIASTLADGRPSMPAMTPNWSWTISGRGSAKLVRIAEAIISPEVLGTWARTSRRKCTRQRCQVAPMITLAMDCLSPVWASDDQLHPAQPAGLERARERGPERAALAVADSESEHLAPPVGAHTSGDHHRLRDHPPAHALTRSSTLRVDTPCR